MTTPLDIITLALKEINVLGVGVTALSEDANDAFVKLNFMLAQWNRKRYLVYRLKDVDVVSTGVLFYTIGPTGDIATPRPSEIESAFVRYLPNGEDFGEDFGMDFSTGAPVQTDYPLTRITSREDYDRIVAKRIAGTPEFYYLDADFPNVKVYVWPRPLVGQYAIYFTIRDQLLQFTTLTQDIALPPEYMAALYLNLATRLAAGYSSPIRQDVIVLAKDALDTIRGVNAQIPVLQMPSMLASAGRYNILSDR